jgi:hypothetical protein
MSSGLRITDLPVINPIDLAPEDVVPVVDVSLDTTNQLTISALSTLVSNYVSVSWDGIQNKPTTVGGYGIMDVYTVSQIDTILQAYSPNISYASATTNGLLYSTDWVTFNDKQDRLVSGTTIKTVNGTSLLGAGDVTINTGSSVSYYSFNAIDGQTQFDVGVQMTNPIVFLNGTLQTLNLAYTFTTGNTYITFNDARVANETVTIINGIALGF